MESRSCCGVGRPAESARCDGAASVTSTSSRPGKHWPTGYLAENGMQHDRQVAIIERIFAHLDAKTTDMCPAIGLNPVEAYFSDAWQASERRHLFGDRGQLLGLSGLLRHAGDYLVDDLGG